MAKQTTHSSVQKRMRLSTRLFLVAVVGCGIVALCLVMFAVVKRKARATAGATDAPAQNAPAKAKVRKVPKVVPPRPAAPTSLVGEKPLEPSATASPTSGKGLKKARLQVFLEEGEKAFSDGNYTVAAELFRRACEEVKTSKEAWLALARAYCKANDNTQAWTCCQEGLAFVPEEDRTDLRLALARIAWSSGRADLAEKEVLQAVAERPGDVSALVLAANVMLAVDRPDEALAQVRRALALAPENQEARLLVGCALAEIGQPQEALGILKGYLAENPESVRGRLAFARIQRLLGDTGKARDALEEVAAQPSDQEREVREVRLDKVDGLPPGTVVGEAVLRARGAAERAELLLKEGKLGAALAAYQALATEHPHLTSVRFRLAELTLMKGDGDGARKLAEKQLADNPGDAGAHTILALVFLKGKLPGMAIDECHKALADPAVTKATLLARRTLAIALYRSGKPEEAVEQMATYLEKRPNDPDALVRQSAFLVSLGRVPEAEELLTAAAERCPESALVHAQLGSVKAQRGDSAAAVASLKRAVELGDKRLRTHIALANGLANAGQLEEAVAKATKMRETVPRHALVADTLAWCLICQRKLDEARPHIEFAIERAPAAPRYRYHHALLLHGQGKTEKAVAELRQALGSPRSWRERQAAEKLVAELSAKP